METATETLTRNLFDLVRKLRRDGTCGMSTRNLKQIVPTSGLTCSIPEFHRAFDDAIAIVRKRIKGFAIYDA